MTGFYETAVKNATATPDDGPMGLPGFVYCNPQVFEREQAMLRRGWHCLARVDELAHEGDFLAVTLLGEPLLVVRSSDKIRVLSNICRHRNMPLAEGKGSAKRFVCSYHAWTYGLDGGLLRAPRMEHSGFDAKNCRLPEFDSLEWAGFLYVRLEGDAEFPHALDALVGAYEPEAFKIVHQAEEVWATNWKCLVENFMEGYHLSVVHPQTLHHYTPTGLCDKGPSGAGYTSYFANYPHDTPSRGAGAPSLGDEMKHRSTLYSVFPCQVVSQAASTLVSLSLQPEAADRVRVRWTLSAYGDDLDAATLADRVRVWEEVNQEDREKLERLQPVLSSPHAMAGPLAGDKYEGTIRDFHRYLNACLNGVAAQEA